jgi:hypothetical protein
MMRLRCISVIFGVRDKTEFVIENEWFKFNDSRIEKSTKFIMIHLI